MLLMLFLVYKPAIACRCKAFLTTQSKREGSAESLPQPQGLKGKHSRYCVTFLLNGVVLLNCLKAFERASSLFSSPQPAGGVSLRIGDVGRWNGTGGAGGSHSAAVRTRMPVFRERLDLHGFTVLQRHRFAARARAP